MQTVHKPLSHLRSLLLGAAVLTLSGVVFAPPAAAQETNGKPKLEISYDLKTFAQLKTLQGIALRPNVEQSVYLYASNPGKDPLKNLTVKLVQVLADNTAQVLEQAKIDVLPKGDKRQRLTFGKPAAPPPPGKPAPPWPELEGPPFRFKMLVESADGQQLAQVDFVVTVMEPKEYVKVSNPTYDVSTQRFSVSVAANEESFFGPPAVVQLELSPEVIPGLLPAKTGGAYRQILKKKGDKAQLIAEKLQFNGEPPKHGRIYVTVDGYERAFIFINSFTEGRALPLSPGTRARLVASRFAQPGAKFPVRVEVDNPPDGASLIDFGFDRAGNDMFVGTPLSHTREQHVYFVPEGPKGGMVFKTTAHDWTTELDTAQVIGTRQIRVQVFEVDRGTGVRSQQPVKLVNEFVDDEKRPGEKLTVSANRPKGLLAPLSFDAKDQAVVAEIMLDGTAPEGIAFDSWPAKLVKGTPLLVKATGRDPESGIRRVNFFLGKPEDGKIPPKAVTVAGQLFDKEAQVWQAELPLPTDKPGKFEVSVQFTNGADMSEIKTVVIQLVDAPGGQKAGTTIKGTVYQADMTPPGVVVSLVDDKNNVKAATKTDKMGHYVFEGVPPGSYRVVAIRAVDSTQGQTAVLVPEGKELIEKVDVKISR
jgi:hypothetical protein